MVTKQDDSVEQDSAVVTDEVVTEEISEAVFTPAQLKQMNSMFTSREKKLQKEIATLKAERTVAKEVTTPDAQIKDSRDPEKAELQKQVKQLMQDKAERIEAAKTSSMRSAVSDALLKNGVSPKHLKRAADILIDSDRAVTFDEDGNLQVRVNGYDQDLDEGVKAWAGSDDNKIFLEPRGTVGSGSKNLKGSVRSDNGKAEVTKTQLGDQLIELFSKR